MDQIVQIISSVGFPIAMCGALCWYIYTVQNKLQELVQHNTEAIRELIIKLDKLDVKEDYREGE